MLLGEHLLAGFLFRPGFRNCIEVAFQQIHDRFTAHDIGSRPVRSCKCDSDNTTFKIDDRATDTVALNLHVRLDYLGKTAANLVRLTAHALHLVEPISGELTGHRPVGKEHIDLAFLSGGLDQDAYRIARLLGRKCVFQLQSTGDCSVIDFQNHVARLKTGACRSVFRLDIGNTDPFARIAAFGHNSEVSLVGFPEISLQNADHTEGNRLSVGCGAVRNFPRDSSDG